MKSRLLMAGAMLKICISNAVAGQAVCGLPQSGITGSEWSGYLASSLVLMTFTMTSMRLLRVVGIASNFAFITYALIDRLPPILVLHGMLLPLNLYRLFQIERTRRREGAAVQASAA